MTRAQAMRKAREILRNDRRSILADCEHMLRSGAVDLKAESDDYVLPKAMIAAAYTRAADGWVRHARFDKLRRQLRFF